MTSSKTRRKVSGFTLIEILLVLALVAVMAGIVAGNAGAFILGGNSEPPVRVLKRATLDALYYSSEMKREVLLFWDDQNATFLIKNRDGEVLQSHPVYEEITEEIKSDDDLMPKIVFRAIGPLAGVDGGRTKFDEDELLLTTVNFHAGSSVPFITEVTFRGETEEVEFDPFSAFVLGNKD